MQSAHRTAIAIQAQMREAERYPGSGRLKAGIAVLRAGINGAVWLGCQGGDHIFRLPGGVYVALDLVARRVTLLLGDPPRFTEEAKGIHARTLKLHPSPCR